MYYSKVSKDELIVSAKALNLQEHPDLRVFIQDFTKPSKKPITDPQTRLVYANIIEDEAIKICTELPSKSGIQNVTLPYVSGFTPISLYKTLMLTPQIHEDLRFRLKFNPNFEPWECALRYIERAEYLHNIAPRDKGEHKTTRTNICLAALRLMTIEQNNDADPLLPSDIMQKVLARYDKSHPAKKSKRTKRTQDHRKKWRLS